MATLLALRAENHKKPSAARQAKVLAGPAKSQTAPPVERDFLGAVSISPDIFSGDAPLSEPSPHPLDLLAMKEELPRLTAEADAAMKHGITTPVTSHEPINWKFTQRDLVATMESLWSMGRIEARNQTDLIRQIVKHFVHQGKPLDENSLRVNLQQHRDQIAGRKK
jgi:hypothetical protein